MKANTLFPFQAALVIDDDEICRALAQQIISALGCAVVQVAENGQQGLQALRSMQPAPDFMLCDIFMPEKDGIEFVMDLVALDYRGGLVLVSGGGNDMLEAAAQIAEVNGLRVLGALHKPLSQAALAQALQALAPPAPG
jgi:CheY-like chemotaxis protein